MSNESNVEVLEDLCQEVCNSQPQFTPQVLRWRAAAQAVYSVPSLANRHGGPPAWLCHVIQYGLVPGILLQSKTMASLQVRGRSVADRNLVSQYVTACQVLAASMQRYS